LTENHLLIMDDDTEVAAFFAHVGRSLGFEVRTLDDPNKFFETIGEFKPNLLILDLQMPGHDGIELLRGLGERGSKAKIFIASGLDSRVLTTAEQLGGSLGLSIAGTFCKPIGLDELKALLSRHKKEEKILTADQLESAISSGQLVVHYLPTATQKGQGRWIIEAAEALVRWQHEDYGLLYPKDFIALAERTDLILPLTDFVFRSAMEQARLWFSGGLYIELGLNLSAQFLGDLEFPDRLLALIRENDLDPSMVTLELTETAAMRDPEITMDILARLRVKNVNLCLDDFGVGYSSLTHLYRMPFNEVKLDNAFINDMRTSDDAKHLVEGLIHLAHKLKMRACAEGVEDNATLALLERMGCDRVQGHCIGQSLRPKALEALVEEWNGRHRDRDFSKTA
jgi:EAL domain-containing protein (putative c-di-GMP-specific phosphodiesterase class I)